MREKTGHWKLPVAVCLAALLALGSIFAVRTETEAASAGKKKAKAATTAVQKSTKAESQKAPAAASKKTSTATKQKTSTAAKKKTSAATSPKASSAAQQSTPSAQQSIPSVQTMPSAGVKLLPDEAADVVQAGLFEVLNNDRTKILNYVGAQESDEGMRYMSMAGGQERASIWSVDFQLPDGMKADGTQTTLIQMTLKNAMAGRTLREGESLQAFYDTGCGVYYKVPTAVGADAVSVVLPVLTVSDHQYLILVITSGYWRPGSGYDYLAIGNSITMHPRQSYWPDAMGMGATRPQNDYYHLVSASLAAACAAQGRAYNSAAFNYAIWEINYGKRAEVLYLLDPYLSAELELVTIQLGENSIPDPNGFAADFPALIQYIRTKAPNAKIVLIGNFWNNAVEETVKRQCAQAYGLSYVDLSAVSVDPYITTVSSPYTFGNELAYDANGVGHHCSKDAVAQHPNNKGMQYIAQCVLQVIGR